VIQGDRLLRFGLAALLAALLATPVVIKHIDSGSGSDRSSMPAGEALSRYGFYMSEASHAAGIDFLHEAPVLDAKLDHIMETVASMGAAVSVADYDRDGWADIYTVTSRQGGRNALYRNLRDGTFRDVAGEVGLADVNLGGTGASMGAVWGDYDNDGFEDLFLYKWGRPELFHNDGGRGFTPVGEAAGLPDWVNANTAVWLDYDRDGLLDLFVGGYYPETVDLWNLKTTRIMPDSFEYANNGGRKYLLHNLGGGRFEEVAETVGIVSRRWSLAAVAADFDGDGYPDLFIANDYGVSELFLNEGGARFREAGREAGVGYAPKSGMNASLGDVFNDGRLSIYVSNISENGVLVQGNNLWVPESGGTLRYENLANGMGVEMGGWSFGAQFGDLNNDGFLDIYATNGYVSLDRERSYWYDFSKVAGGNEAIISDAANWPPLAGRNLAGYQRKRVWLNDGYGRFTEVSQMVGVTDVYDGRAVAIADFGNRGALDVVVANQRAPLLFYRNSVAAGQHWLELELEGRQSNRSAIGARVTAFWGGGQQVQEVSGGSGFGAQNDRRLHFGLGDATDVDRVEIRWPSGATQVVEAPEVDRVHRVQESE
jgi:enediyne biosynthesis protein E4